MTTKYTKKKKTLNSVEVIDNLNTFNNPNGGRDKLRQRERRELTRLKERCVCEGQNGDRHEVDHWLAVCDSPAPDLYSLQFSYFG